MLQRIDIDGFRSLVNFGYEFRPGLNVIVGPNGAGKSNLISFLDFLGEFIEDGLDAAIAVAKGAGSLFSVERNTPKNAHLRFSICGYYTVQSTGRIRDRDMPLASGTRVDYRYQCSVRYNKTLSQIFVESDSIHLATSDTPLFSLWRHTQMTEIGHRTRFRMSPKRHPFSSLVQKHWENFYFGDDDDEDAPRIEQIADSLAPGMSLLRVLPIRGDAMAQIFLDATSYRSINIEPSLARKPSPVSRMSSIEFNGENLSGTIYRLSRGEYYPTNRMGTFVPSHFLSRSEQHNRFSSILSWTREVNPSIQNIEVRLDLAEALLKGFVSTHEDQGGNEFAFSRLSDGTIKWITLVTILFSQNHFRTIEEPENFLHPRMQESFISLCRDILEGSPADRQILISTHSQTLLNCCNIDEISVFDSHSGLTHARRAPDIEGVRLLIEDSGFGAGDLYRMGALDA
ncbi:AAA family ATPase [Brevundimonas sp. C43]|uniref:AAA family ATPase n=1 Tax=Brevundimonas sp. C43 TaxID=3068314 RepID=UPI0027400272|nr:ATP-binding protein [Brevundimonas sp. C43]